MSKKTFHWICLALSVFLALGVGAVIMALAGYDPLAAYGALLRGATGCESLGEFFTSALTKRQFGNTLEYTMVLCLTSAFCSPAVRPGWPFRQRLWERLRWGAFMPGFQVC